MLSAIRVGDGLALVAEVLLKCGIEDKLLADRVTRELPAELVSPLFLLFLSGSAEVFLY